MRLRASGRRKSLRYQPTVPVIEAAELSPAFQAFGTLVVAQPSVFVSRCHAWVRPTPAESRRNSHEPPTR